MNKIQWHTLQAAELSQLLQQTELLESRAVGATTVYHLALPGRELLALSLPDGQALVMEPQSYPAVNRRKRPGSESAD
ncbi:hypothetical protein RQP54_07755 [Curvibacter sp. APW13]|uniref:hypothetical protein n=1 Tax=Curvibacter sp. APW13 TaxID=3077236 RepID=UPI0028DDF0BB|nr:hypothetical protein [Curvibacter sp. APW13]MDT8990760.1 hypothetical protein [Curvibacter sp. APW13]